MDDVSDLYPDVTGLMAAARGGCPLLATFSSKTHTTQTSHAQQNKQKTKEGRIITKLKIRETFNKSIQRK